MPVVGRVEGSYEPHRVEEEVKRFWEENQVYRLVKEARKGQPRFYFLDGPPYPSSDVPHAGTAWNKVLKDTILRYMRLLGYDVVDKPGYDCHGLPIEVMVERRLGVKVKREIETKVGVERFIEECKKLVSENVKSLTRWFKELGVFMDWDNPYMTLTDEYIEAAWWLIKRAHERGLLAREYRVVYWCPRCETTLAEYEVEYKLLEDPSIYVKFRVKGEDRTYLLVWTTTPWTLPANMFVMAHPDAVYAKVRVGDEYLILLKSRVEEVMREAGVSDYEIVAEIRGRELEGLEYEHPLEDVVPLQERYRKYHRVVLAGEYVSLYEGTGLVHAAPAHGFEDFEVAKRLGILGDIVVPVNESGRFTGDAGKYAGMAVREANPVIIEDLEKRGALFHKGTVKHRYPVCWRCKTPVVLRATSQWVIKVTKLADELKAAARRIQWIPDWALKRLENLLDNLQDWVISRQRYWGTPLPIWVCSSCGNIVVVGSVKELEELGGIRPPELHRPWIDRVELKCPKCGKVMKRVPDVADVWLDSGVAFYASVGHPSKVESRAADFITEGHDQIRGWFFSLLRAGIIGFGEPSYHTVLVHGFMLDEKGREMHKSLGNYVGTDQIIEKVGRDVFRFWVLQNTPWEDARFSWRALEETRKDLAIVWNVFVFATTYMSLDKFEPTKYSLEDVREWLRLEDKWLLSRCDALIEDVRKAVTSYRIHDAVRLLRKFMIDDVSHWYIKLVRRRVWVEEDTPDKLAVYVVLYHVLKTWLALAAPVIPFLAEYLYQKVVKPAEPSAPLSVHMLEWPKPLGVRDPELERDMEIVREVVEAAAAARMKAGLKLRQPVKALIVYTDDARVARAVKALEPIVRLMANTKQVRVESSRAVSEIVRYRVEPRYERLGPRYRKLMPKILEYLKERGDMIARGLLEKGVHRFRVGGVEVEISKDDVEVVPYYVEGFSVVETSFGCVAVDTRLSWEEIAEGIARDVIRRIQFMRKLMSLEVSDYIEVYMSVPDDHKPYIEKSLAYIAQETRAVKVNVTERRDVEAKSELVRSWEIYGEEYVIGIRKAKK